MGEVTASSGEYSNTMTIIVYVNDIVNENAPVFTSSDTFSAAENQTAIGTVTATDADGDAVTYSITASANTDNAFPQDNHTDLDETDYYEVSPSAGESVTLRVYDIDDQMKVTFKNSSGVVQQELTYSSTTNQPSFTINVLDYITADGSTIELELTNNPSSGGFTMGWELSVAGSVVYSNSCGQYNMSGCAGDSNSNGVVYESTIYVDANSSVILIDANSGVLTFNSAPDYETKSTYTATVTASDGTYTTNQNITVNVTDVNEGGGNNAPVATAASYNLNLLPKDQNLIGFTLSGTDADGDSLTYSIVSGPSQGTVSLSGANVTYQTNSGVDTAQTDTFTFKVNDGTADSDPATISVNLKTDPLYQHQWHLHNYGQKNFASGPSAAGFDLNVDTVIANGYTGAGVLVSVVDEGLEIAHADLAGNVVAGSWDFGDQDNDPTRPSLDGDHGTSVAGIINSVGWNNVGGRGVAPEASLIGYNWLDHQGGNTQYESWGVNPPGGVVADVYNLSYGQGYEGSFAVGGTIGDEAGGSSTQDALRYGTTNHRNGLGALYIKSTGNAYNESTSSTTACGEDST